MKHIEMQGVNFYYGSTPVLQNISFALEKGSLSCLIGLSGSGKTTLLRLCAGFEQPRAGKIFLREQEVAGTTNVSCRDRNIGFVFQNYALFNHLSVQENIEYGCTRAQQKSRGRELAIELGIQDHLKKMPTQLSGGEKQRVALARALAVEPDIIFLDEPFAGIDRQKTQKIVLELRRLFKKLGVTALMITHSLDEAINFADHLMFLDNGEILQQGQIQEFFQNPKNEKVKEFFGEGFWLEGNVEGGVFSDGHCKIKTTRKDGPARLLVRSSSVTIVD